MVYYFAFNQIDLYSRSKDIMASFSQFGQNSNRKAFSPVPLREKYNRNDDCSANIDVNFAIPTSAEPCRGGDMLCTLPSVGGTGSKSPVGIDTAYQYGLEFITTPAQAEFLYSTESVCSGSGSVISHDSWIPGTWHDQNNYDRVITFPSANRKGTEMSFSNGDFFSLGTKVGLLLLACFSPCEMTKSRWGMLVLCCTLLFKTPS